MKVPADYPASISFDVGSHLYNIYAIYREDEGFVSQEFTPSLEMLADGLAKVMANPLLDEFLKSHADHHFVILSGAPLAPDNGSSVFGACVAAVFRAPASWMVTGVPVFENGQDDLGFPKLLPGAVGGLSLKKELLDSISHAKFHVLAPPPYRPNNVVAYRTLSEFWRATR
jgi:hypothetical protein